MQIGILFGKKCKCQTILVKRKPEEYYNAKYSKQCVHALFNLLYIHCYIAAVAVCFGNSLLSWIRKITFIQNIYGKRNCHCYNGNCKRIVKTCRECVQILFGKCRIIGYWCTGSLSRHLVEFVGCSRCQITV